jgi:hypothetical protein
MKGSTMKTLKHSLSPRQIALGALAMIGLLALAGCVVTSVYPYYTAKDVTFEPKLLGCWAEADQTNETNKYWEFARGGTNDYKLAIHDGDEVKEHQVHLFRLKEWTFLDVVPVGEHDDFIPPHYLLKVSQIEPALKTTTLDYKWLGELLEKQPGALRHICVAEKPGNSDEGRLVLTANTAELQKFILKHAANTNAFTEAFIMRRK